MNIPVSELLDLYNPSAPLEEAYTIPAAWYLDERIERLERDHVFGRNWISVGRVDQVAVPGSVLHGRAGRRAARGRARNRWRTARFL